ncbi:hypothetical protein NBO_918g0001 [Nosema bombycis CQ1]|uniref:Nuclear transport factor 2 domain-containing protein n=1 Tax=Nosema bombycis (strain CQ1 / CVCC 102059) TaxID=578461 RepID=R0KM58_NOSB1|nr:hypothetical protein NBO_918g0001 [Nosema bombycis CQ1]|eukprot:EOB11736.1 hypothetical protein NBO_918g0001 [Nosema bombycis CQ1]
MSSYTLPDEIKFIRSYYELLCNDPTRLSSFYAEDYKCLITKENNDQFRFNSIKSGIPKPVYKVLISNFIDLKVDTNVLINVISQFVFNDKSQFRVSRQFLLSKNLIKSEIITFLDEEIVYDWIENKIKVVSDKNKNLLEVVKDISKFCNVESVEKKGNNKFLMKT